MARTRYKRKVSDKAVEQMLNAVGPTGALVHKTGGQMPSTNSNAEVQTEKTKKPKGHPVRGDSLAATIFGVERESVLREMRNVHVRM